MKSLVLGVLLVGCGGGGGGSIAIDDLGTELSKVSCSKTFECCTSAEIMAQFMGIKYNGQPITTEAQCEGFAGGFFNGLLVPEYKASIMAGRLKYDGDAARGCIDAAANLSCSAYSMLSGHESIVCEKPFLIPLVADGGGCTQDYECISANCEGATVQPGGPNTDGMCKPLPTAGQSCTSSCAQGLYCSGTCKPLLANGTQCTGNNQCASNYCSTTCMDRPPTCDGI